MKARKMHRSFLNNAKEHFLNHVLSVIIFKFNKNKLIR